MAGRNWRRLCTRRNPGPVGVMLQSIQAALLAILDAPMRIMRKRIRRRAPPPPPQRHAATAAAPRCPPGAALPFGRRHTPRYHLHRTSHVRER